MKPLVAIVGRPNVGKSTLFNRIIRSRKAIVQDRPGVTRDRNYGTAQYGGHIFDLVDTGGFEPAAKTGIEVLIREQTQLAIEEADLVLLVMDIRDGVVPTDRDVIKMLRTTGKPVLYVANKADSPKQNPLLGEFYQLGASQIWDISAEHDRGVDELLDAIVSYLPPEASQPESFDEENESNDTDNQAPIRLALVGRPNAGKSSMLNCLVGEQRAIVSEQPGTTRDPLDVPLETAQGKFILVDTAGIRRKKSASLEMERYAMFRAMKSIGQADVACLVIDGAAGIGEQDAKIAGMVLDEGRGLVLALSKSDLLKPLKPAQKRLQEEIDEKLQFLKHVPIIYCSAANGQGMEKMLSTARRVYKECGKRISTSELNRFLEEATDAHPHPSHRGRQVRFYFITQPHTNPPTFVLSTNNAEAVHVTYRRFLANRLRERFGFAGAPLRLFFRNHRQEKK